MIATTRRHMQPLPLATGSVLWADYPTAAAGEPEADPEFPTSADFAPLPEPAQAIRDRVLMEQGIVYHRYAAELRGGIRYGAPYPDVIRRELRLRVEWWRDVALRRSADWWVARFHLCPVNGDWSTHHICRECGRPSDHVEPLARRCLACEGAACCDLCGWLANVRYLHSMDGEALCGPCASLPVEPDGEPVDAEADVWTGSDLQEAA